MNLRFLLVIYMLVLIKRTYSNVTEKTLRSRKEQTKTDYRQEFGEDNVILQMGQLTLNSVSDRWLSDNLHTFESERVRFLIIKSSRIKLGKCIQFMLQGKIQPIQLDITESGLTEIPSDIFAPFEGTLKRLDMSRNEIFFLAENAFRNLMFLQYLSLTGNKLREIPRKAFNNLPSLRELFLPNNKLKIIQDTGFVSLPKLSVLSLNGNELRHIPYKALRATELSHLDLAANNITDVAEDIVMLTFLEMLDVQNNQIKHISSNLTQIENLEALYINNNLLTAISPDLSKLFNRSDFHMTFGNNPWNCDCSLVWLIQLVKINFSDDDILCVQPVYVNMTQFDDTQIACEDSDMEQNGLPIGLIALIVPFAILGVTGTTVAIVYLLKVILTKRRRPIQMIINGSYYRPRSVADVSRLSLSTNNIDNTVSAWNEKIAQDINFTDTNTIGKVRLGRLLGRGAFGDVYEGVASGVDNVWRNVAVKKLRANTFAGDGSKLGFEFHHLVEIGRHPNIIQVYGSTVINGSLIMVMELAEHGDLLAYVREKERYACAVVNNLDKSEEKAYLQLKHSHLFVLLWNVAKGMEYLSRLKIIHRDLAARNILVAKGPIAKISDFGLSRDVYETGFYCQDSSDKLPYKWISPESLSSGKYTTKSDVWSYGILMWEVVTLGSTPYPGIPPEMLLDMFKAGYIIPQPPLCPDTLYTIMQHCWNHDANQRVEFEVIVNALDKFIQKSTNQEYIELVTDETTSMLDESYPR